MFSGIIEAKSPILKVSPLDSSLLIELQRPPFFDDIKLGDSIATNGVCLTVESFTNELMRFVVGAETIRVLARPLPDDWLGKEVNLERSLRFGDRIHGHLVSGHVEGMGTLINKEPLGDCVQLDIKVPAFIRSYVLPKGSLTIQGVSLTVNSIADDVVSVCLIPETIKRTNLAATQVGETLCLEPDYLTKALIESLKTEVKSILNRG